MASLNEKIQNLIFKQDGKKKTLNKIFLRQISVGFSCLGLLAVLVGEPKDLIKRKAEFTLSTQPGAQQSLSLPEHQSDFGNQSTKKNRAVAAKLPGPSVISRPGVNDILPGTVVKARLQTAATDGPVKAILTEDVIVGGETKIPNGSVLIGIGQSLDSRVGIQFSRAIVGEREVLKIGAVALDFNDQLVGLQASRMGGEAIRLGTSIGLNFVGGMTEGLKDRTGINGAAIDETSTKNALLNGASRASLEEARSIMEESKNKKISLMVDSGTLVLIFFNGGN